MLVTDLSLGPDDTVLEQFETTALFLLLGLLSIPIWRNYPLKTELFENTLPSERI